ncbi:MAG: efflux RND transporter periplasmic adaptor subunit [bacterium]|nr:efflux RND transporter periplasmic adaptor subunit [bacterium]
MTESRRPRFFHSRNQAIATLLILVAVFVLGFLTRGGGAGGDRQQAAAIASEWTCSMHPQVRQPEFGLCPLCAMDLIPVGEDTGGDLGRRELRLSAHARKLASLETALVERRHVDVELRLPGTVEFDETHVKRITAWVAGRLEEVHVNSTYETVAAGQALVDVYSPGLIAAQEELLQALRAVERTGGQGASVLAQRTLAATREKLSLLGLTSEQILTLERTRTTNDRVSIPAPLGGVVLEMNAIEGRFVDRGTPLYTIADLSQVWVQLAAYESDLSLIATGQTVTFESRAWPGEIFAGQVDFIDPVLDEQTRTTRLRVVADNSDGRLKPGMFVHATLLAGVDPTDSDDEPPLVIPASAPLITGRRAVVYVAHPREEGRYEGREVVLGARRGDFYEVQSGLFADERVVTRGNFKLDSALQILARPSMMNPPAVQDAARVELIALAQSGVRLPISDPSLAELENIYVAYFALQFALSHDDYPGALSAGSQLKAALSLVDPQRFVVESKPVWQLVHRTLVGETGMLADSGDMATARAGFEMISFAVTALARSFGRQADRPLLTYFCPMAFDYEGASWLQEKEGTENPYYGSQMFKCGSQLETLSTPESKAGGEDHE